MAENENLDDDDLDLATEGEGKKNALAALLNKNVLMMIGGGILLVALSIGATLLLSGGNSDNADMEEEDVEQVADKKSSDKKSKKKKGKGEKEPVYFSMEPSFVVNFNDKTSIRYLQSSIELLVTDALVIDDLKKHMPLIRNNLLLLLGSQTTDVINTREGKQRLRNDLLKEIQKVMKEKTGEPGVEAVYFTSFVVQ